MILFCLCVFNFSVFSVCVFFFLFFLQFAMCVCVFFLSVFYVLRVRFFNNNNKVDTPILYANIQDLLTLGQVCWGYLKL